MRCDLLLRREPADYDVATDATPRQVMQIFLETYAVGEQFGVVLVPLLDNSGATGGGSTSTGHGAVRAADNGKRAIEVATFRWTLAIRTAVILMKFASSKDPRRMCCAVTSRSTG